MCWYQISTRCRPIQKFYWEGKNGIGTSLVVNSVMEDGKKQYFNLWQRCRLPLLLPVFSASLTMTSIFSSTIRLMSGECSIRLKDLDSGGISNRTCKLSFSKNTPIICRTLKMMSSNPEEIILQNGALRLAHCSTSAKPRGWLVKRRGQETDPSTPVELRWSRWPVLDFYISPSSVIKILHGDGLKLSIGSQSDCSKHVLIHPALQTNIKINLESERLSAHRREVSYPARWTETFLWMCSYFFPEQNLIMLESTQS